LLYFTQLDLQSRRLVMPDKTRPKQSQEQCPYTVLGISFVAEERGRGARLVLRYPVTSSTRNLFGTLPPRVMAKLFRLKHSLCNRSTTISVGDTVFCCRAVLLDECGSDSGDDDASCSSNGSNSNSSERSSGDTNANANACNDLLTLFSVIVALGKRHGPGRNNVNSTQLAASASALTEADESYSADTDNESTMLLSRVHLSLSQICRALEREEQRSGYVTNQVARMLPILDEYNQRQRQRRNLLMESGSNPPSDIENKGADPAETNPLGEGGVDNSVDNEDLQAMFEDMLILKTSGEARDKDVKSVAVNYRSKCNTAHSGNLAREMAEFYHCLSMNDEDYHTSSASSLSVLSRLMGCESIVNINGHIGVHISPISESPLAAVARSREGLRPYHTLLFPKLSLLEVHRSLLLSKSIMPKRLKKLLLAISAQKSLNEISTDASLPLSTTCNLASQLIRSGICIAAPVMRLSSVYVCNHGAVQIMKSLALPFAQRFGNNSTIYMFVGMIVSEQRPIGDILETIKKTKNLRCKIYQPKFQEDENAEIKVSDGSDGGESVGDELSAETSSLDERFFETVIWLRSRSVIIELNDYLISVANSASVSNSDDKKEDSNDIGKVKKGSVDSSNTEATIRQRNPLTKPPRARSHPQTRETLQSFNDDDQLLYNELQELNLLSGVASTAFVQWRAGIDRARLKRLIEWGQHNHKIAVISRIPSDCDLI